MTFFDQHVADGATVDVGILPDVSVRGQVVWSTGYSVGIQFERTIDPRLAVRLQLAAPPAEMTVVAQQAEATVDASSSHRLRQLLKARLNQLA